MVPGAMTRLPSGTVTFLFTDVEGSTKLLHELGAESYADALAEHRQVVRQACAACGGVEVDTQGDAFFVAFPTALGALDAARVIGAGLEPGLIQVRMGLHTGTPLVTGEGYVGEDVHLAARVAAAGHGGQVLVSSSTVALAPSDTASQGVAFRDLGEHRFKDIEGTVAIFQLGEESFPPLKTISNTNLPRPASSFVGREIELQDVLSRIAEGARLLTLTGPGGSGKTRLALEAAALLVPEYKSGVFWVGLAVLRDPALVSETISQTLGAKGGLAKHIGERELLLLLDNLEQVIEAAPELSFLLSTCPNLSMLVTSRELLRVQGEVEYLVPPLAEVEAVTLFCERAQTEPSDEIAELCARLDSLPLAVELAAARTKALSPSQILDRLSQRLDLLQGGRDADPRQQTLRATIEWSHDLLSKVEQRLFRSLSVFSGGCALEAAEEVCGADLDTLQSLVEKSLLRFSGERYFMLETIREYAGERLERSGEANEFRERHADRFLHAVQHWSQRLTESDQQHAFAWFDAEIDNVRAAGSSLLGTARDAEFALLARHTCRYLWRRGSYAEHRAWLTRALALGGVDAELHAQVSLDYAGALLDYGEVAEAAVIVASVQELAGTSELQELRARAGFFRGHIALHSGDHAEADARFSQAAADFRELGDERYFAVATWNLAVVRQQMEQYGEALELLGEALTFHRSVSDSLGVAWLQSVIAGTAVRLRKPELAGAALDEALTLYQELGPAAGFHEALIALAELALPQNPRLTASALELCHRLDESGVFELTAADREQLEDVSAQLDRASPVRADMVEVADATRWAHESLTRLLERPP
jgi:predicted ATPase/class 3 adenylate cyclase